MNASAISRKFGQAVVPSDLCKMTHCFDQLKTGLAADFNERIAARMRPKTDELIPLRGRHNQRRAPVGTRASCLVTLDARELPIAGAAIFSGVPLVSMLAER